MKNIAVFFCLLIFVTILSGGKATLFAKEVPAVVLLDLGTTHYVFEKKVNIRANADRTSDIVDRAEIGDSVVILDNGGNYVEYYGVKANWYQVQYGETTGYLWGGLISTSEVVADFDNDGSDEMLLCLSFSKYGSHNDPNFYGQDGYVYTHQYRLCRQGDILNEKPFKGKSLIFNVPCTLIADSGFDPPVYLVWLQQVAGDKPEMPIHGQYWWFKGDIFVQLVDYQDIYKRDYSKTTTLHFPNENSTPNSVIMETIMDEHNRYSGGDPTTDITTKSWLWNGKIFEKK